MRLDRPFAVSFEHRVRFTQAAFDPANDALASVLADPSGDGDARRLAAFVDAGVLAAHPTIPELLARYLAARTGHGDPLPELACCESVPGGESTKDGMHTVDQVLLATERFRIDRRSVVLAVGGGAVLDAVGFAAATAHRGVRHVRMPTTVLAQDDAAMGVKNGINRFGKKNYVGAFCPPDGVVCDRDFLPTLPVRHFLAGFSEAVKIACLRDRALLERIEQAAPALRAHSVDAAWPIVIRSAELHLDHVTGGGDPFERLNARPLDFGHWAAHKLEQVTGFELPHGEAVAIGVALDCAYSMLAGMLPEPEFDRVVSCLRALGLPVWHPALADTARLMRGLDEFREHLGGQLTVTLLRGIGSPEDVHAMEGPLVARAAERLSHLD
jgi:3-dehydroquinate synthase